MTVHQGRSSSSGMAERAPPTARGALGPAPSAGRRPRIAATAPYDVTRPEGIAATTAYTDRVKGVMGVVAALGSLPG
jgi:hypothetical protein